MRMTSRSEKGNVTDDVDDVNDDDDQCPRRQCPMIIHCDAFLHFVVRSCASLRYPREWPQRLRARRRDGEAEPY